MKSRQERLDEIWPLLQEGLTDLEISETIGLSLSRVGEYRRTLGVGRPKYGTRWTPEIGELFERLIAEGWPASEIGGFIGFEQKGLLRRDKTGKLRENGNAAAGVRRWARKMYPDTYESIYNTRIT